MWGRETGGCGVVACSLPRGPGPGGAWGKVPIRKAPAPTRGPRGDLWGSPQQAGGAREHCWGRPPKLCAPGHAVP